MPTPAARKQEKGPNIERSDATLREEQILDVAARLFMERGYQGTTLLDVAQEIGVTRTAVYHYFSSKEQIFYRMAEQAIDRIPGIFEEIVTSDSPPEQKMRDMLRVYVRDTTRKGPNLWLLLTEGERNLPSRQYRRLYRTVRQIDLALQRIFREGVQSGTFANVNPKIAVFVMAGACNWLARWYDPQGELDSDAIVETFMHVLEQGYLTR